jgi:penicillin-binding protein 2
LNTGTGRWSQVKGIEICGKTGTSENSIKIVDGIKVQAKDHSILIAFAPKVNPKIAIAVFVENGGFGSTIAAPITSLLIEKYLNGSISEANKYRERNILMMSLQETYDNQIPKDKQIAPGKE